MMRHFLANLALKIKGQAAALTLAMLQALRVFMGTTTSTPRLRRGNRDEWDDNRAQFEREPQANCAGFFEAVVLLDVVHVAKLGVVGREEDLDSLVTLTELGQELLVPVIDGVVQTVDACDAGLVGVLQVAELRLSQYYENGCNETISIPLRLHSHPL